MRKTLLNMLLLSSVAPLAFDAGPGWKKDADGKLELDGEGNPIFVNAGGQEQSVKGDIIANLNSEAKNHRTAKEAAEAKLAKFVGKDGKALDPELAAKAVETVANIDAKKLIDAGEVDKVRETIKAEYDAKIAELNTGLGERDTRINGMLIDKVFDGSEFVRDRVAIPVDMFRDSLSKNFKVEEGKVIAYDRAGNRVMSKKSLGDAADANEALELLVDMHPQKDMILKAAPAGGSGNNGNGGGRGGGNVIKRGAYDAMSPAEQAALGPKLGSGEVTLAD